MAASKALMLLFAVLAVVAAQDVADKPKRDVVIGAYPYGYAAHTAAYAHVAPAMTYAHHPAMTYAHHPAVMHAAHAYDDGKYYPGKYEKASFYPTMHYV